MTEEEARARIAEQFGPEAVERLSIYADLLRTEAARQNLVSAATLDTMWTRHLVDSAQLLDHAPEMDGTWVDIGTGAGLPGLVVALLCNVKVVLVEPRRLRVEFLQRAVERLELSSRVAVAASKVEALVLDRPAAVISARAVAALPQLLLSAAPIADRQTLWLLPKGRSAHSEVAAARQSWHGSFHVEPSLTDPEAGIVVATGVYRR